MEILGLRILQNNNLNQIQNVIEIDSKQLKKCVKQDISQTSDDAKAIDETIDQIDMELVKNQILNKIMHHLTFNRTSYFDLGLEFLTGYGRIAVVNHFNMLYFYTQQPMLNDKKEEVPYLTPIDQGISLSCEKFLSAVGIVDVPDDYLPDNFYIHHLKYHFDTARITFDINQVKLMNLGYAYIYKAPRIGIEEKYLLGSLPKELKQICMLFAMPFENEMQLLDNIRELNDLCLSTKIINDFYYFKGIFKDVYKYYYLTTGEILLSESEKALEMLQLNDLVTRNDLKKRELYGANIMISAVKAKASEAHNLSMDEMSFDFPGFYEKRELILKLPLEIYNPSVFENCVNNSKEYLARRFINEEVIIDTALVTFIARQYIQTDTNLVDIKVRLLTQGERFKEITMQPLHDLAQYLEALLRFTEKHKAETELFNYFISATEVETITNIINTITNLLVTVKPSCHKALVDEILKELKEQGTLLHYEDYKTYLRKDATLALYSDALNVCSQYTTIDLKTLKRAANHQHILKMIHHELKNAFSPMVIRGKDYLPMVLFSYVRRLLHHNGKPTKEQKGLYHKFTQIAPIDCRTYSQLSNQAIQQIIDIIETKNKLQANVLRALPEFEAEVVDANDYRNLITGNATNCCMSAGTKKQIVYTYSAAFNQIIITNTKASRILLDIVIWRNLFGYLVLDNIEAIQVNLVNAEIYKILLYKISRQIIHKEHLKGFVQGTNYNDLELYLADSKMVRQPCIAIDRHNQFYHHFYSDAHNIKLGYEDPVTLEKFNWVLPNYIDAEQV